jgi:serine/threonine-protein kinase HipA
MTEHLVVDLYGQRAATLTRSGADDYRLEYDREWAAMGGAIPLSLSLPLPRRNHRGSAVSNFIDNLLPDNPDVRERWATRAGLSTVEPFGLLEHYGQDVAGALSFRRPGAPAVGELIPLDDSAVAERIRTTLDDPAAWHDEHLPADGQFSLGGAQTKFSLARRNGAWYEAIGAEPSTHIVKPRVNGARDGEIVEYLTMRAAALTGIPAAGVDLLRFDDQYSLVVERFDRTAEGVAPAGRLHQEDLMQALGRPRLLKYERDGGPSIDDIAECLTNSGGDYSADSTARLAQVLAFSWIMLNSDAHAKNHSVFIDPDGAQLTPLYDASSLIPYLGETGLDPDSVRDRAASRRLSMRYGASFLVGEIGGFELGAIARRCGLASRDLVADTAGRCLALPGIIEDLAAELPESLQTEVVARFVEWMPIRAEQAVEALVPHF